MAGSEVEKWTGVRVYQGIFFVPLANVATMNMFLYCYLYHLLFNRLLLIDFWAKRAAAASGLYTIILSSETQK